MENRNILFNKALKLLKWFRLKEWSEKNGFPVIIAEEKKQTDDVYKVIWKKK